MLTKLIKAGILGMNFRNGELMSAYNPRELFPRVDSKILSKELCSKANIPVPKLYDVISSVGS